MDIECELTRQEGTGVFTAPKCVLKVNGKMEPDGSGGGAELEEVSLSRLSNGGTGCCGCCTGEGTCRRSTHTWVEEDKLGNG